MREAMLKLYSFWRSSASYRARIALALKALPYETVGVDLLAGAHAQPDYAAVNPQRLVPTLVDGGAVIAQSLAIIEYLDETHPAPPLLPPDAAGRARVRQMAQLISAEMQPFNQLRVRAFMEEALGIPVRGIDEVWVRHWLGQGFEALERMLAGHPATGTYCHGDTPTMADICLLPQVALMRRRGMDLAPYPTILRIDAACRAHPAFIAAAPDRQPDYRPG